MQGLERVYRDLDGVRNRITRLVDMERIPMLVGAKINGPIIRVMDYVNDSIEKGVEREEGYGDEES